MWLIDCEMDVHFGSISKVSMAAALVILAAGCRSARRETPAIGEAFAGPSPLRIRADIPLDSAVVATIKHGDKVQILQRRRRFFRVRAPSGAEGLTDERQLLSATDMEALHELSRRAAKLPVQGQAVSYSDLNVHTLPARGAPSFLQVKAKEKVDVLTHLVAERNEIPRKSLIPPPPKKAKSEAKKPAKAPKYPPPPMPKPPAPPSDWLDLSKSDLDEEAAAPEEAPEAKPVPTDNWSLVRLPGGDAGWVLTRRLSMAIPDEVAQYAEGHRIVSYFSLGKVQDEAVKKDIWLWTTAAGNPPYDFDSFRVFNWSLRRHRYETAYIERNIKGYSPVLLRDVQYSTAARVKGETTTERYPGFSVCVEKADGQRYRREYALLGNIVRFAGEQPCEPVPPVFDPNSLKPSPVAKTAPAEPPQPEPKESLFERVKKRFRSLTGRKQENPPAAAPARK
jgi:hypothetical protein